VIPIEARRYGSSGPRVVLLHGGPGAPGYLATLADALADAFRVLEPLQRRSAAAGGRPLTVARHVDDLHDLLARIEACDPVEDPPDLGRCDARAYEESWTDMLRLQSEGVYPAAFAAIDAPVLMLHGEHDTLPGEMIRATLAPFLRRLEYRALARCGHYPWLERQARHEFLSVLRAWLTPRA
jgi:pimeloyl-ACP methyl ester carboxylesterase